ncbi:hypothetical protein [Algirhabdus cladophorae]|uniref:hypothetical protein n=1 Tax=Algirhabdus cladophorae TaxID=3377108 RepID=UPI003B84B01F
MPRPLLMLLGLTGLVFLALNYLSYVAIPPHANGQTLLDLRPLGYSVQTALDWAAGLTATGRDLYLGPVTYFDAGFMVLLAVTIAGLAMHLTPSWTVARIGICVFAVIYLYVDVQEGYLIRQLVLSEGGQGAGAYAAIASLSTKIKFAAVAVCLIWLLGLWRNQRMAK